MLKYLGWFSAFEIARLSETSDYNIYSDKYTSSYPSDKWTFSTKFDVSLYNAVIEHQNTSDCSLENSQRSAGVDRDASLPDVTKITRP